MSKSFFRKWFVLVLALLLVTTGVNAQKIDQRLTRLVDRNDTRSAQNRITLSPQAVKQQIAVDFNADGSPRSMSAIATLKKGEECPTQQLEQMGIEVRYQIGDMVVLNIPADKLLLLEDVEEFSYIRADEIMSKMNDKAREATNVSKVNTKEAATAQHLPKAYTGDGVIIGVIDGSIDYNHAAFRNADGTTRIKKVIDYSTGTKKEYDTDEAIKTLTTDDPSDSHGTHTSSIAGGSDLGNGQQGMAPQAELVLCGLGRDNSNASNIAACIKDIFDYAEAQNKPAVINISLGKILGLHDGSNIVPKAVAELTANGTKAGHAVVISAGNSANNWQSIVKKFSNTTEELKTVLGCSMDPEMFVSYNAEYCIYADDYKDFSIQLKAVNLKTGEISEVGKHTVDIFSAPVNVTINKENIPTLAGGTAVFYRLDLFGMNEVYMDSKDYRLALVIKAGSAGQTIKMACNGNTNFEPCFDAPAALSGFTKGNGDFALSTSVCNDNVISVGSYITRIKWVNYNNESQSYPKSYLTGRLQEPGEISDFSSYGIDDNGKARPTLIAPGMGLISGASNYDESMFKEKDPGVPDTEKDLSTLCPYVDKFGRKNWYWLSQGTSMSAPVVTGIVALWMQAKPTLTTNEILDVMKKTSVNDEYTTDVTKIPSGNKVQAGWGKIDCLAGLKEILGTTDIETISMDGHREATPSTMYSVDAPVYNMMGQRVDKSQKGLVIYKGQKYVNK